MSKINSPSWHSPPPNTWFEWCTLLGKVEKTKNKNVVDVYWKKPPSNFKNSMVYFRFVKVNSKNKIIKTTEYKKICDKASKKKQKPIVQKQ